MTYIFYTMIFLIGAFIVTEIVDVLKRREWGENP